jgi:hypothetical protein
MDIDNPEFLLFLSCAGKNNLRYMCIGGYAVNYYGFHRATNDMDIWIAPTNENKDCFLNTLLCMGYSESEITEIKKEDFSTYFMLTLGAMPHVIDILTIVHKNISFDDAEKNMTVHPLSAEIKLQMISYDFLKEIKLLSTRPKDLWDVARLEELRNQKNAD